ncbi:hypothetical protein MMC28_003296 [Mycoblastus sanguinarius]|nr:hypothetical protein [Mycoblastus sanguinarius]
MRKGSTPKTSKPPASKPESAKRKRNAGSGGNNEEKSLAKKAKLESSLAAAKQKALSSRIGDIRLVTVNIYNNMPLLSGYLRLQKTGQLINITQDPRSNHLFALWEYERAKNFGSPVDSEKKKSSTGDLTKKALFYNYLLDEHSIDAENLSSS